MWTGWDVRSGGTAPRLEQGVPEAIAMLGLEVAVLGLPRPLPPFLLVVRLLRAGPDGFDLVEVFQLPVVEEDAVALVALFDLDASAFVRAHQAVTLRTPHRHNLPILVPAYDGSCCRPGWPTRRPAGSPPDRPGTGIGQLVGAALHTPLAITGYESSVLGSDGGSPDVGEHEPAYAVPVGLLCGFGNARVATDAAGEPDRAAPPGGVGEHQVHLGGPFRGVHRTDAEQRQPQHRYVLVAHPGGSVPLVALQVQSMETCTILARTSDVRSAARSATHGTPDGGSATGGALADPGGGLLVAAYRGGGGGTSYDQL